MLGDIAPTQPKRSRGRPGVPNARRRTVVFDGDVLDKVEARGENVSEVIRDLLAAHVVEYAPDASLPRSATPSHPKAVAARENFDDFVEYLRKDEYTGTPVVQCDERKAWTDIRHHHAKAVVTSTLLGKTVQFAVLYPLWLLGRDPACRVAIVGRSREKAAENVAECTHMLKTCEKLREVFPALRFLGAGEDWLTVERPEGVPDPSLQAYGADEGRGGSRFNVVVFDDVVSSADARHAGRMKKQRKHINVFLHGLVPTPHDGRTRTSAYLVGSKKWGGDLYDLMAEDGWPVFNFGGDPARF